MGTMLCFLQSGCGYLIFHMLYLTEAQIIAKTTSTCNGPCGQLFLSCPAGQRVAIRDAVYSVQKRTPLCKAFKGCNSPYQDICCEKTPQDCVFAYTPAQVKALHSNCSGLDECVIQTERLENENVRCSSAQSQLLSSQTTLSYVCISDSVVADICSPNETVIQGRTLFAMIDSRRSNRPSKGSVCSCIAESIKWPTSNTIAVFLVDMRLNMPDSSECANTSLSVRSGNKNKTLNCQTMHDPRMSFPFVAVLNDSNVAALRLELSNSLPEYVWLGFEANENEDIRLTCKLQGLSPAALSPEDVILRDLDDIFDYDHQDNNKAAPDKAQMPAIIGGVVAAIVLVAVAAAIITLVIRKKSLCRQKPPSSQHEFDITYYSTTEETLRNVRSNLDTADSSNRSNSTKELYVSADEVIANKRKSNLEQGMNICGPGFSGEQNPEYASTLEVLKRKSLSRKARSRTHMDRIPPSCRSSIDNNYDRLNQHANTSLDTILESYDYLGPETVIWDSYSFASGVKFQRSKKNRVLDNSKRGSDVGAVNQAYDNTIDAMEKLKLYVVPQDRDRELDDYSESENPSNRSQSKYSYFGIDDLPPPIPAKTKSGSLLTSSSTAKKSPTKSPDDETSKSTSSTSGDDNGEIYNDAESEATVIREDNIEVYRGNRSSKHETGYGVAKGKANNGDVGSAEQQVPVAAPRRKSISQSGKVKPTEVKLE